MGNMRKGRWKRDEKKAMSTLLWEWERGINLNPFKKYLR